MDELTYRSLSAILEYLCEDERKHWEELGKPDDHIYTHIQRVQTWADDNSCDALSGMLTR